MKRKPTMERPTPLRYTDKVKKINTQYGDTFKLLDKFRTICLENGMKWDMINRLKRIRSVTMMKRDTFELIQALE